MNGFDQLNPRQREAVLHTEGPLIILAGPGSGKTRTITHRVAHLIRACSVRPDAILAITFTNKAAQEMQARVQALLSDAVLESTPRITTFHKFCVTLLRREGASLAKLRPGFTTGFSICDADAQRALTRKCRKDLRLEEFMTPRDLHAYISRSKNLGVEPSQRISEARTEPQKNMAAVFDAYNAALRNANALDFDDLLLEAVRLLRHDAAAREGWSRRLGYVMVDEYQDTNAPQYSLIHLLTLERQNICVVGDDDQSIYGWRGADIENVIKFKRDYPGHRSILLDENYRSTGNIVAASRALIEHNGDREDKALWTSLPPGEPPHIVGGDGDEDIEAEFIARQVKQYLADNPTARAAVLYRMNATSQRIEEALHRHDQAYVMLGGVSFYERREIQDAFAYMRLAVNHSDSISLRRIINSPKRGLGKDSVELIEEYAAANGIGLFDAIERMAEAPQRAALKAALVAFRDLIGAIFQTAERSRPPDLLRFILARTDYIDRLKVDKDEHAEERIENLQALIGMAEDAALRGENTKEFLDSASLVNDVDKYDENAPVTLMTLHTAKGLEFDLAIIAGAEDGLIPHSRMESLQEERRLFYVGATRAKRRLIVTWASSRRGYDGKRKKSAPSPFLRELRRGPKGAALAPLLANGKAMIKAMLDEVACD